MRVSWAKDIISRKLSSKSIVAPNLPETSEENRKDFKKQAMVDYCERMLENGKENSRIRITTSNCSLVRKNESGKGILISNQRRRLSEPTTVGTIG